MVNHIYSLHLSTFIIFIILNTSNCYDHRYEKCSSFLSCGNVTNIGYPFWGGGRPKYCGHPALQLQCPHNQSHDYPVLHYREQDHDMSFQVLGISNNDSSWETIKLVVESIATPKNPSCPTYILKHVLFKDTHTLIPRHWFESLFKLRSSVSTPCLFYNCKHHALVGTPINDSITCSSDSNFNTYYLQNQSDTCNPVGYIYEECKYIQAPVLTDELHKLKQGNETLMNVLKKGFEVDFYNNYSRACFKCVNSGGVCGSLETNPDQFVCYCKDHPHFDECHRRIGEEQGQKKAKKSKLNVALRVGIISILLALNVALCCYIKKNKFRAPAFFSKTTSYYHTMSDLESGSSFFGIPVFSYDELQEATNNFDSARELGDGGFGVVYYGKLIDGREVAVKRLYEKSYKRVGQFMNEVVILTKLRHTNLVTLYGCTSRHSRELLLVYEFVPNGTVADHLYKNQSRSITEPLPWNIRMKIAVQTACALSYLHASDIIHRDVKTSNILVDNSFTVKVADFGLSRLFPFDVTHISTAPHGTPGYLDPEYHKCYQVSNKSDVYSFGVVLIELISSLPAIDINRNDDEINLSDYAMKRIQNGELETLVDKKLGFESDFKVKRMISLVAELAFGCLQHEKEVRPPMEEVYETLKSIESVDYEVLESQETRITKPSSVVEEIYVGHHQEHPSSPNSVIEDWASRSTASDPTS